MSMIWVAVGLTVIAGGYSAWAQQEQGKAAKRMYDYQAGLAVQAAAMRRTYAEEQKKAIEAAASANVSVEQAAAAERSRRLHEDIGALSGMQKTTIAKLGLGGVTAEDIITGTFDKARLDQFAIRYNANIKSWAIKEQAKGNIWTLGEETKMKIWSLESEASQYRLAGSQAKRAGDIQATGTILNTAASVFSMKAMYGGFSRGTTGGSNITSYGVKVPSTYTPRF